MAKACAADTAAAGRHQNLARVLRIKVSNAGLSTSDSIYNLDRLNWHLDWEQAKNQAERRMLIFLLWQRRNSYTGNLRPNLSAISDIAFALEKDYVLATWTMMRQVTKAWCLSQDI